MFEKIRSLRQFCFILKQTYKRYFPKRTDFGQCGKNTFIEYPIIIDSPKNLHVEENVKIRSMLRVINSPTENVYIKKYTVIASDCMIITNNHKSTVTVPQFLLGSSHVNDISKDITIEEDVWVGARVILLPGAHLCRGCGVGAGSIISSEIPPYSVVVGQGRIVARKFDKDGIKKHEKALYKKEERMSEYIIDKLFKDYLDNMRTYGYDKPLTEKDKETICLQKRLFNFIEPSYEP